MSGAAPGEGVFAGSALIAVSAGVIGGVALYTGGCQALTSAGVSQPLRGTRFWGEALMFRRNLFCFYGFGVVPFIRRVVSVYTVGEV